MRPRHDSRPPAGSPGAALHPRWWQWPTVLSLDAPAVVMAWQALLGASAGVAIGWAETLVVGASVWLAYAADRWLEAARLPLARLRTPRHRFYADHRRAVVVAWVLVLVADVALALRELDRRELTTGLVLLAPVLLYVLSHQFLHREARGRVPKEIIVALLITGGAAVFVLAAPGIDSAVIGPALGLLAAVCFTNVALICVWEVPVDTAHGQLSLARQFPRCRPALRALPWLLAALAWLIASRTPGPRPGPADCVALSSLLLALLDRAAPRLGWERVRVWADVALLTPLWPLLLRAAR
ncbi:hypothetical protein [Opitutus sp. ER46]|uniref:hypothetical protein n=1 Tax=Opitutus sp. ER46 TaxID=2161864 RepID=UPI0011B21C3C|nr:hypothetical protein [Opitutus sp. ER46]